MAECPFCGAAIEESLAIYGGTCPSCFAEIPGEEAPTDPGEVVKAAQQRADVRRARRRWILPSLLAAGAVLGLGGFAAYQVLKPPPEMPVIDLDAAEYFMADLDQFVAASDSDPAEASKPKRAGGRRTGPPRFDGLDGVAASDVPISIGGGPDARASGLRGPQGSAGGADIAPDVGPAGLERATQRSGVGLDPGDIRIERPDHEELVLTDQRLIGQMAVSVIGRELPRLKGCYNRSLKENDSLQGSWRISLVVGTKGTVAKASATGLDVKDASFEKCMVEQMSTWRFQKIAQESQFNRTLTFRPS